ncbi:MAG: hypothetical protein ACOYWZ_16155 [Bacillota bacterium]
MTKKDYILIGDALKRAFNWHKQNYMVKEFQNLQKQVIIDCIGLVFQKDNSRFDFNKWNIFFNK